MTVTLSEPGNGVVLSTPSVATVTIQDDDGSGSNNNDGSTPEEDFPAAGRIRLGATEYSVAEDATTATITVVRDGDAKGTVTVDYALAEGTATSGREYDNTSGTLNFADGESLKTFDVTVNNNSDIDGNKTVKVNLSNITGGAAEGDKTALLTIYDDEISTYGPGSFKFGESKFEVLEKRW